MRITAKINSYSWHDEALIQELGQWIIKLSFVKTFSKSYKKTMIAA